MDEYEWLSCTRPRPMLEHLGRDASERKLRLFAVACCRRIWDTFVYKSSRTAVEVCERFADGLATLKQLRNAHSTASRARDRALCRFPEQSPAFRPCFAAAEAARMISYGSYFRSTVGALARRTADASGTPDEERSQADCLREIFGNPFRPVTIDAAIRAWRGGLIVSWGNRMYDAQDYSDLPVMADALEEAGCTSEDLLAHCRGRGPHLRGCWALDLILGKNDEAMLLRCREYNEAQVRTATPGP